MEKEKILIVEEISGLSPTINLGDGTAAFRIVGTIADGGDITFGAKTDAKNSATDETPISAMQILKQISASAQNPVQQRIIRTFKSALTLGDNQTLYSANDVILDIGGVLNVWDMSTQLIKTSCTIMCVRIQTTDPTGLAGKNLRLHLFNDEVDPIADNSPFVLADIDDTKREGTINITMGTGVMSKEGQANYENVVINPVAGKIYFILEDVDGHTPSADSTVINCYIKVELGN